MVREGAVTVTHSEEPDWTCHMMQAAIAALRSRQSFPGALVPVCHPLPSIDQRARYPLWPHPVFYPYLMPCSSRTSVIGWRTAPTYPGPLIALEASGWKAWGNRTHQLCHSPLCLRRRLSAALYELPGTQRYAPFPAARQLRCPNDGRAKQSRTSLHLRA